MDIGSIQLGVLTTSPTEVQATVDSAHVLVIGDVPYRSDGWYTQTVGVQTFDLTNSPFAPQLLAEHPLVVLSPIQGTNGYKVLLQESIGGLYVRADSYVFRIDPGETQQVEFYASRFGVPLPQTSINVSPTEGFMGSSGGGATVSPGTRPAAQIPRVGTPPDAITYGSAIATDSNAYTTLPFTASAEGPGVPRGYIKGQLFGIAYQLAVQPSGYVSNPLNYVSILAFSRKDVPEHPTWYADIQYLFTQYGNLYPIMGRYVVNLSDYASVVSRIGILTLAFSLPIDDPNHMPVTRDLGAGDRATILKWLNTKGPDGFPPLGTPLQSLDVADPAVVDAQASDALPNLRPEQGAGKTAVILQLERRHKIAPGSHGRETK
jgi:hypothetical protein